METNNRSTAVKADLRLFGNTKVLVISAVFIAMSIVLGKFLAFNITSVIRISFENLPVIMAGIFFGPFVGAAVGIGADLIGCLAAGYAINPVITLGAAAIGFISGAVYEYAFKGKPLARTACSVGAAHLIGSLIIKTAGLYIAYPAIRSTLIFRIPTYIGIAILETYIIFLLLRNKAFAAQLEKVRRK